jgi:hypothetical protein
MLAEMLVAGIRVCHCNRLARFARRPANRQFSDAASIAIG